MSMARENLFSANDFNFTRCFELPGVWVAQTATVMCTVVCALIIQRHTMKRLERLSLKIG